MNDKGIVFCLLISFIDTAQFSNLFIPSISLLVFSSYYNSFDNINLFKYLNFSQRHNTPPTATTDKKKPLTHSQSFTLLIPKYK